MSSNKGLLDQVVNSGLAGKLGVPQGEKLRRYKKGEPAPDHTKQNLETLDTELEQLHAAALPGSAEEEMLQRYRGDIAECRTRIDPSFTTPYNEGGKIAMINPFEKHGTAMVTEMVPDPTVTA